VYRVNNFTFSDLVELKVNENSEHEVNEHEQHKNIGESRDRELNGLQDGLQTFGFSSKS